MSCKDDCCDEDERKEYSSNKGTDSEDENLGNEDAEDVIQFKEKY